ncbi:hypothetical protein ACWCPT_22770 [Streptomyces sp. NPDC002308]
MPRTAEARGAAPQLAARIPAEAEEPLETATRQFREAYECCRIPRGDHLRADRGWVLRSVDLLAQYDSFAMMLACLAVLCW